MWFDSLADLGRVALVGFASYGTLLVSLRISGKRTLAQLNAFDLIVTVALGSVLATILLSSDVSWIEGALAFAVLIVAQLLVAIACARAARFRRVFSAEPALLLVHGEMREHELRRNRLGESDVLQAVRGSGSGDIRQVAAVVLESNGTFSVITESQLGDGSTLPFDEFGHGERPA